MENKNFLEHEPLLDVIEKWFNQLSVRGAEEIERTLLPENTEHDSFRPRLPKIPEHGSKRWNVQQKRRRTTEEQYYYRQTIRSQHDYFSILKSITYSNWKVLYKRIQEIFTYYGNTKGVDLMYTVNAFMEQSAIDDEDIHTSYEQKLRLLEAIEQLKNNPFINKRLESYITSTPSAFIENASGPFLDTRYSTADNSSYEYSPDLFRKLVWDSVSEKNIVDRQYLEYEMKINQLCLYLQSAVPENSMTVQSIVADIPYDGQHTVLFQTNQDTIAVYVAHEHKFISSFVNLSTGENLTINTVRDRRAYDGEFLLIASVAGIQGDVLIHNEHIITHLGGYRIIPESLLTSSPLIHGTLAGKDFASVLYSPYELFSSIISDEDGTTYTIEVIQDVDLRNNKVTVSVLGGYTITAPISNLRH